MKVGLVGCGYIAGRVHLPILVSLTEGQVVAVCDQDEERAEATARRFDIPRAYGEVGEMMARENLDIVDVCTPADAHYPVVRDVLEGGAHCLVEKPLTTTLADADAVIQAAEEKDLRLYVIHNISAVMPSIGRAREMVASGALGDLLGVDLKYLVPAERRHLTPDHWLHRLPGDIVAEMMPHMLMLLLEFLEDVREVKVSAAKRSTSSFVSVDEIRVILEAGNALGTLTISFNCPSRRVCMDIFGTRMSVYVDADSQAVVTYPPHPGTEMVLYRGWRAVREILQRSACLVGTGAGVLLGRYAALTHGHQLLLRQALRSARGDGRYPVELGRARDVVRLFEMISEQLPTPIVSRGGVR